MTTTAARPTSRTLYGIVWIPYLPDPCLLTNRRRVTHWSAQNEATQALRMAVKGATIHMDPVHPLPLTDRVEIAYTVYWGNRYPGKRKLPDPDALQSALKAATDGLIDIGILVDDSDEYVGAVIPRQKRGDGPSWGEPGVFVQIVSEPREVKWDE